MGSTIHDLFGGDAAAGNTSPSATSDAASSPDSFWTRPWVVTTIFGVAVVGAIAVSKHAEARAVEADAKAREDELLDALDDLRFELAMRRRGLEP
jgi:hypothetical protein